MYCPIRYLDIASAINHAGSNIEDFQTIRDNLLDVLWASHIEERLCA